MSKEKNESERIPLRREVRSVFTLLSKTEKALRGRKSLAAECFFENRYRIFTRVLALFSDPLLFVRLPAGRGKHSRLFFRVFAAVQKEQKTGEALQALGALAPHLCEEELLAFSPVCALALCEAICIAAAQDDFSVCRLSELFFSLEQLPFERLYCENSAVERIFLQDPEGSYKICSRGTKALYREKLLRIAYAKNCSPLSAAKACLAAARRGATARTRHIGRYLIAPNYGRRQFAWFFTLAVLFFSFCAAGVCAAAWGKSLPAWMIAALVCMPAGYRTAVFFCEKLFARLLRVHAPLCLAHKEIPACGRTLVCVPILLCDKAAADEVFERLEKFALRNPQRQIRFCMLADLAQAKSERKAEDDALLRYAQSKTDALNRKYGARFLLLVRRRTFCAPDKIFMGWERKRGALLDLVRLLQGERGAQEAFLLRRGAADATEGICYVLTLDADTEISYDCVLHMVNIMLHPLNRAVLRPDQRAVVHGFGILQPGIAPTPKSVAGSRFAGLLAGQGGFAQYQGAAFESAMQIYGCGAFCGKGMFEVRAYAACLCNAFPENSVLSHDLLEGARLRCLYVPQITLMDDVPQSPRSFFKRMERWQRGDVQALPFALPHHRDGTGKRVSCAATLPMRFCQFENLFSMLYAPSALSALFLCAFLVLKASFLLFVFLPLLLGAVLHISACMREVRTVRQPCSAAARALLLFLWEVVFSARSAGVTLGALFRALYRMFVTRKNMLLWVTASQTEKLLGSGRWMWLGFLRDGAFSVLCGAVLSLSASPVGMFFGVLFLLAPAFEAALTELTPQKATQLAPRQRETVQEYARASWSFFAENVGEETAWLPPDNVQFQPKRGRAMRTSPTNIGMYAMSVLAARDFELITTAELYGRLDAMRRSIDRLKTWHGNLYNWYELKGLTVLSEHFVSSVDSGNFVAALFCVGHGILEYADELLALRDLSAKLLQTAEKCSLAVFYDAEKELFSLGCDPQSEKRSQNTYDLYLSEARMLSFLAIARHEVPPRHLQALSRAAVRMGKYGGLASWSGTAFEAFMPNLWLKAPRGTLEEQALGFAEFAQRRTHSPLHGKLRVFGKSESGYFAFDAEMNYQYRAFGAPQSALDVHAGRELVYAPYASFLMLPFSAEKQGLLENLSVMRHFGAYGEQGFSEAVDFTPRRVGGGYAVVHSCMAHHVGMSLCALANAAFDGTFQRRFARQDAMRAAEILLWQQPIRRVQPHLRELYRSFYFEKSVSDTGNAKPQPARTQAVLLSDSVNFLYRAESGEASLFHGTMCICREDFSLDIFCGGKQYRLLGAGSSSGVVCSRSEGTMQLALHTPQGELRASFMFWQGGVLRAECAVPPNLAAQARVLISFSPVLAQQKDYERHPSFSKLFLEAVSDADTGLLLLHRRARGRDGKEVFCGIAADGAHPLFLKTAPQKEHGESMAQAALRCAAARADGAMIEPYAAVLFSPIGGMCSFSIAVKKSAAEVRDAVMPRQGRICAAWQIPQGWEAEPYAALLTALFGGAHRFAPPDFAAQGSIADLWKLGISGDVPILYCTVAESSDIPLRRALLMYRYLRLCGIFCELCIGYTERDGYQSERQKQILSEIDACGLGLLCNVPGGIFLLHREENEALFCCMPYLCEYYFDAPPAKKLPSLACKTQGESQSPEIQGLIRLFSCGFDAAQRCVWIEKEKCRRPMSYLLASAAFGTLLTQNSLGYTWVGNAQKQRLTPWFDGKGENGEHLLLSLENGACYDLCACADTVCFTADAAYYYGTCSTVSFTVRVQIAKKGHAKYISVHLGSKTRQTLRLAFRITPLLRENRSERAVLSLTKTNRGFFFENRFCAGGAIRRGGVFLREAEQGSYFSAGEALYCLWQGEAGSAQVHFTLAAYETARELKYLLGGAEKGAVLLGEDRLACDLPVFSAFTESFLPRQILRARLLGRSGYDQSGGAYGFRDQLQDTLGFLTDAPQLCRLQLLRCAAVQFPAGDVLHWWYLQKEDGRQRCMGIRTRCSDDFLWFVYVLCAYLETTQEDALLSVCVPYLGGAPLAPEETERFGAFERTQMRESIYMHAVRALEHAFSFGAHGLCLMGSGDWNDGMNEVGVGGAGESVWLSMFLALCLRAFLPICRRRGDGMGEEKYRSVLRRLEQSLAEYAWDENWFLRGFYDDGAPLGKKGADACAIDLLPQAFAALLHRESAGTVFSTAQVKEALDSAIAKLFVPQRHLLRLLTPPFDRSERSAGYIGGYAPGVRENGGQYTHGAMFFLYAMFASGRDEEATALLFALTPALFCKEAEAAKAYGAEPYALAGDVYDARGFTGRAGWTQYTGAAAWYRKIVYECLFGIHPRGEKLYLRPHLCSLFPAFTLETVILGSPYKITARRTGSPALTLDGSVMPPSSALPLDGKAHTVFLTI